MDSLDATATASDAVRVRVIEAIRRNRTAGLHFPGHFLGIHWPEIKKTHARLILPEGPHARDTHGHVDITALAVFVDVALGTAARLNDAYCGRQATVFLQLQLTGHAAQGELTAIARRRGNLAGVEGVYALCEAEVSSGSQAVCRASGKFVRLASACESMRARLPWQFGGDVPDSPANEGEFCPSERAVLDRCDLALACGGGETPFIRRFWAGDDTCDVLNRDRRIPVGLHIGNRVGHVQGGILLGLAILEANCAAPTDMRLSNASAWYVRPGLDGPLTVHASLVHAGKMTALVDTEIRSSNGALMVKAVTQHVGET